MTAHNLVTGNLAKLTRDELADVADRIAALLAELPEDPAEQAPGAAGQVNGGRGGSKGGAWLEARMIGDNGPYIYRRWREGGKKRSEYMGKAKTK